MACSKFEYVKKYEEEHRILPNCWFVLRIDGHGFSRFSQVHDFEKPNDEKALCLMNEAAMSVMTEFGDICLAYGQSDEFSFIFRRSTQLWSRREGWKCVCKSSRKILSNIVSLFTSNYVLKWPKYFGFKTLKYPPSFDGRIVAYPTDNDLRNYLSWRQADCHVNNQYNTCFAALVRSGRSPNESYEYLKGTDSAAKNELLFSEFSINYNDLPPMFKKGSILLRQPKKQPKSRQEYANENQDETRTRKDKTSQIILLHVDMIGQEFWDTHPYIICWHIYIHIQWREFWLLSGYTLVPP